MSFSPKDVLDILGIDSGSSEMQVLKTVIELSEDNTKNMSVNRIHEGFVEGGNRNVSLSWIYKCLKGLEKEGLVLVNSMRRPHQYDASPSVLRNGLLLRLKQIRERKQTELDQLSEDLDLLNSLNIDRLARHVFQDVLGAGSIAQERVLQGIEAVRNVMIYEMASSGGRGDVLSTIQPLASIENPNTAFGTFEKELIEAMKRGLVVRALLVPPKEDMKMLSAMNSYLGIYSDEISSLILDGRLELRILAEHRNTYRMMCFNGQMMLLFISELYQPDTAAVFYSHDSDPIISDTMKRFSELWEASFDFGKEMLHKEA